MVELLCLLAVLITKLEKLYSDAIAYTVSKETIKVTDYPNLCLQHSLLRRICFYEKISLPLFKSSHRVK